MPHSSLMLNFRSIPYASDLNKWTKLLDMNSIHILYQWLSLKTAFFKANSTAIPLTDVLGLALALLLWNTTSCIMGWATSRFGLFGVHPAPPKSDVLNYAGLVLLVVGWDSRSLFGNLCCSRAGRMLEFVSFLEIKLGTHRSWNCLQRLLCAKNFSSTKIHFTK